MTSTKDRTRQASKGVALASLGSGDYWANVPGNTSTSTSTEKIIGPRAKQCEKIVGPWVMECEEMVGPGVKKRANSF